MNREPHPREVVSGHDWLAGMPKCELHLHIDGSLQPARLLSLAEKNAVAVPYRSVADVERACEFTDLQSFLDLYYLGASVLRTEEDFYHLMMDYLQVCRQENILHTEIMVEPQTYFPHGVSLDAVMGASLLPSTRRGGPGGSPFC